MKMPELPEYFDYFSDLAQPNPDEHTAQLAELRRLDALRSRLNDPKVSTASAPLVPLPTLETLHRRNIYIVLIDHSAVNLVRYDYANTLNATRIMDWALDAYAIFHPLLPDHTIQFQVLALDEGGQADLLGQLATPYHGLPYQQSRLSAQHIGGGLSIVVQNSNVLNRWLGGIRVMI